MSEALKPLSVNTLKNRGNCCKSGCLHCPYGFTIKKFGFKFAPLDPNQLDWALAIAGDKLKSEVYGLGAYQTVWLKDVMCGLIRVERIFIREYFLLAEFSDQNITKELLESYYFA